VSKSFCLAHGPYPTFYVGHKILQTKLLVAFWT